MFQSFNTLINFRALPLRYVFLTMKHTREAAGSMDKKWPISWVASRVYLRWPERSLLSACKFPRIRLSTCIGYGALPLSCCLTAEQHELIPLNGADLPRGLSFRTFDFLPRYTLPHFKYPSSFLLVTVILQTCTAWEDYQVFLGVLHRHRMGILLLVGGFPICDSVTLGITTSLRHHPYLILLSLFMPLVPFKYLNISVASEFHLYVSFNRTNI